MKAGSHFQTFHQHFYAKEKVRIKQSTEENKKNVEKCGAFKSDPETSSPRIRPIDMHCFACTLVTLSLIFIF